MNSHRPMFPRRCRMPNLSNPETSMMSPEARETVVCRGALPLSMESRDRAEVHDPSARLFPAETATDIHLLTLPEALRQLHTLREVGRRKDEFLAFLGHELRNP